MPASSRPALNHTRKSLARTAHLKAATPEPVHWWLQQQPDYIVELGTPYVSREARYNFLA